MREVNFWKSEDIEYLKQHYADTKTEIIAKELGFKVSSVRYKASRIGLKKSKVFWQSVYQGKSEEDKKKGQFPKGNVPHNKGLKMSADLYEKASRTFFKKGHKSTSKEVGTISKRGNKRKGVYLYIRIDGAKWVVYHRYVWEQHNGSIPQGHIVAFIDGNIENCAIENLMLISQSENMKRNSIHVLPNEIKTLIYLKRALKMKINKMKKRL